MPLPALSEKQLKQYREDGYILLGRVMDEQTLHSFRDEEKRFHGEAPMGATIFRSQLCNYSEPLRRFCTSGAHLAMAQQLVGTPHIALWFNQFVTKMPDGNSGKSVFPWHQDNGYISLEPATNITIWIALDDVDERNGCVWVMPGSHKQGLLQHNKASKDSWHMTLKVEGDGVPAVLKAGEAVAFTGLTLHRSKLNLTNKPRRGFFIEYCDARGRVGPTDRTDDYFATHYAGKSVLESPDSWVVCGEADWAQSDAARTTN